jgi:hypothetical protein
MKGKKLSTFQETEGRAMILDCSDHVLASSDKFKWFFDGKELVEKDDEVSCHNNIECEIHKCRLSLNKFRIKIIQKVD